MRKPIIAGNWKMFKTRDEAVQFIFAVNQQVPSNDLVDSVICSQAPLLETLVKRQGDYIRVGAQNMHFEDSGAFTGEVSPLLLKSLDVKYVIIGHSERRAMFGETDELVNKKLHAAFKHEITPILCVGEELAQRENNLTESVISSQLAKDLAGLSAAQVETLVIAYEPIWAIGTGKTATSQIANETCGFIRAQIASLYNQTVANNVRIQYGGSVKVNNIVELMAQEHIDGALIGGASLVPEDFVTFTKAAIQK
jgi:triosephosphate isomerase (TIM)